MINIVEKNFFLTCVLRIWDQIKKKKKMIIFKGFKQKKDIK